MNYFSVDMQSLNVIENSHNIQIGRCCYIDQCRIVNIEMGSLWIIRWVIENILTGNTHAEETGPTFSQIEIMVKQID